jgi:hypothetical protein
MGVETIHERGVLILKSFKKLLVEKPSKPLQFSFKALLINEMNGYLTEALSYIVRGML